MAGVKGMKTDAMAIVGLAASVVMGIAVINGFKATSLIENATADLFVTGLSIYGTFAGIVVLALVGKLVIGLFSKE